MRATMMMPNQNPEKLPATRPDRMSREAPPSRALVTTSRTCREFVEVKALTSSGMRAPARVPQEMMMDSFHHIVPSPIEPSIHQVVRTVSRIDMTEVIQTKELSGFSKSISGTLP